MFSQEFSPIAITPCLRTCLRSRHGIAPGSSRCRRGSGRLEWAAASPPGLAGPFAFFRRHLRPALFHAAAHIRASGSTPSQSAEEDTAESQQSNSLPERDLVPTEERRQQPIPQVRHYLAAYEDKEGHSQNRQRRYPKQSLPSRSHVQFLMLS